jgi:predicted lipoprotein with Yx(FWY)xxD motif
MGNERVRFLAIAAIFSLAVSACANGDETDPAEDNEPDQAAEATVAIEDSELGQVVVDSEGQTLYVFLADEGSESTCYEDCEANWPPLTVEGNPAAGEGVDASLLGTTEREDGSVQLTLGGRPLYYDVWYVVSPEGEPITAKSGPSSGYTR